MKKQNYNTNFVVPEGHNIIIQYFSFEYLMSKWWRKVKEITCTYMFACTYIQYVPKKVHKLKLIISKIIITISPTRIKILKILPYSKWEKK